MDDNFSNINLDNCDLYEYVMEVDQLENSISNSNENVVEEFIGVTKKKQQQHVGSFNIFLIIVIVLILMGLYFYFDKNKTTSIVANDSMLDNYYLM
jgi:hypothetical protein